MAPAGWHPSGPGPHRSPQPFLPPEPGQQEDKAEDAAQRPQVPRACYLVSGTEEPGTGVASGGPAVGAAAAAAAAVRSESRPRAAGPGHPHAAGAHPAPLTDARADSVSLFI